MYSSVLDMLELVKIHNSQELTDHRSEQGKLLLVLIMMWCCKYFALADVICCSDLHVTHSSSTACPVHNQAISLARSCMHKWFFENILSHLYLGISYRPKKFIGFLIKRKCEVKHLLPCSYLSSNRKLFSRGPAGVWVHIEFDSIYCLCQEVDF